MPLQTNSGWFFSGPYRDKIKGTKRVNNLFDKGNEAGAEYEMKQIKVSSAIEITVYDRCKTQTKPFSKINNYLSGAN